MATVYFCSECGYESPYYLSGCPACGRGWFSAREEGAAVAANRPQAATNEWRVCYKCDFETGQRELTNCPRCGQQFITTTRVRVLGAVLIALGGFLVIFMGAITVVVAGIIAQTGKPGSTQSFSGGPKEMLMIFGLFGLVIAFGLTCVVAGAWQAYHGRRSRHLLRLMMIIVFALFAVGGLIQAVL